MNQQQQLGEGRKHDDDAALTEFLSSLMDYTPTVSIAIPYFLYFIEFHNLCPNYTSSPLFNLLIIIIIADSRRIG